MKINGVRIEPAEVQATIAAHPGVAAAAVIAVKSDDGIARLAAFVVARTPSDPGLLAALRSHVARSLPTAMMPATFDAIDRIPLSPNGKTDRAALATHATKALPRTPGPPPSTPLEQTIARVWGELLGKEPVDTASSFFDLGGHSLLAVRMLGRVREATGRDVPLRILFEEPTIAGLARTIAAPSAGAACVVPDGCRSLVALRATGGNAPLFVFPGGNGGDRELYVHAHLAEIHLDPDQPVFALRRRGWDGNAAAHTTLDAMARDYVAEIRSVRPHGPYLLLGDCTGGNIAHAVACRLRADGEPIAWLALADCIVPRVAEYARYWARSRWRRLRQTLAGRVVFNLPRLAAVTTPTGREWLRERLAAQRDRLDEIESGREPEPEYWTPEGERYRRVITAHRPGNFDGRLHLLLSEGNSDNPLFLDWGRHAAGGAELHPLPGDHWNYLWQGAPAVAELVARHARGNA